MDRKAVSKIVTGALLIVAGICVFGQLANLWNLSFLLDGWWTLFLIVPAVAGIIVSGPRPGNVMLLLLGVWLFLDCQGWLGDLDWSFLIGIILILLGVRALTGWGGRPGRGSDRRRHRLRSADDGQ